MYFLLFLLGSGLKHTQISAKSNPRQIVMDAGADGLQ